MTPTINELDAFLSPQLFNVIKYNKKCLPFDVISRSLEETKSGTN